MIALKTSAVGDATALVLPKEVSDRLQVQPGDTVYLTESPDGYKLTPYDPEFEKQMQIAETGMRRYADALRKLAK